MTDESGASAPTFGLLPWVVEWYSAEDDPEWRWGMLGWSEPRERFFRWKAIVFASSPQKARDRVRIVTPDATNLRAHTFGPDRERSPLHIRSFLARCEERITINGGFWGDDPLFPHWMSWTIPVGTPRTEWSTRLAAWQEPESDDEIEHWSGLIFTRNIQEAMNVIAESVDEDHCIVFLLGGGHRLREPKPEDKYPGFTKFWTDGLWQHNRNLYPELKPTEPKHVYACDYSFVGGELTKGSEPNEFHVEAGSGVIDEPKPEKPQPRRRSKVEILEDLSQQVIDVAEDAAMSCDDDDDAGMGLFELLQQLDIIRMQLVAAMDENQLTVLAGAEEAKTTKLAAVMQDVSNLEESHLRSADALEDEVLREVAIRQSLEEKRVRIELFRSFAKSLRTIVATHQERDPEFPLTVEQLNVGMAYVDNVGNMVVALDSGGPMLSWLGPETTGIFPLRDKPGLPVTGFRPAKKVGW